MLYVSQRSGRVDKATTLNTYANIYENQKASGGKDITQALFKFGVTATPTKLKNDYRNVIKTAFQGLV